MSLISLEPLLLLTSALPQYKKLLTQSCSLFLDAPSLELGPQLTIVSSLHLFNKPSPIPRFSPSLLYSLPLQTTVSLDPTFATTQLPLTLQFPDKDLPTEEPMVQSPIKIQFGFKLLESLALSLDFGKLKISAMSSKEDLNKSPTLLPQLL